MRLLEFEVEGYKAFSKREPVEVRALTIFVGRNNSGKSALARALPLLAGGLGGGLTEPVSPDAPLPLTSFDLVHGKYFEDLIHRRSAHGSLRIAARFEAKQGEAKIDARVQNVAGLSSTTSPLISRWSLSSKENVLDLERLSLEDKSEYQIGGADTAQIRWNGLRPAFGAGAAHQIPEVLPELTVWADNLTYLRSPRVSVESPFRQADTAALGTDGSGAAQRLAASSELLDKARRWFLDTFGCRLDVRTQGEYLDIEAAQSGGPRLLLGALGQGLTQVLPVVVRLLERSSAPGIDIIEHPEAELHPGAHAAVAELILAGLSPDRPLVIETHSEMLLLRVRRWMAEKKLEPKDVAIHWIEREASDRVRRVALHANGEVENWPEGVFNEDYEEILAIRRAARKSATP